MNSKFIQSANGFFVHPQYQQILAGSGLNSLEAVFAYNGGQTLTKSSLASWRHRIRFKLADGRTAYLKRYDRPPVPVQFKGWIQHGRRAFLSDYDKGPLAELENAKVPIPQTIAYGGQRTGCFEKCSFIITLEIPNAHSLESKLPDCFEAPPSDSNRRAQKAFIGDIAAFIRRFHATGYRHRDLYLAHLFLSEERSLYLIDLHRTFKPRLFSKRYRVKDLAQLHYSCPANRIGLTNRLRFYLAYVQRNKLTAWDKAFIRKIHAKALWIARHEQKHGRLVPFQKNGAEGKGLS